MKDSFLVLSHLHEDREKAKAELISKYDINEVYQSCVFVAMMICLFSMVVGQGGRHNIPSWVVWERRREAQR